MKKAVIDVGTNSVRLLIAQQQEGKWETCHNDLASTRLGQGFEAKGQLTLEAMERTVAALIEFVSVAKQWGADSIVAVATSAVRDSSNQEQFIQLVQEQAHITLEVITGEEEAWLSYQGVTNGLPKEVVEGAIVVDIGGGSTEFIWEQQGLQLSSLPMGAVRMHERRSSWEDIRVQLQPILDQLGPKARLIGVGGTATTLAAMAQELEQYDQNKVHGFELTSAQVECWYQKIADLSLAERLFIKGLQPKRADIIEYGLLILSVIMKELNINRLIVSETDILYGLLDRPQELSN